MHVHIKLMGALKSRAPDNGALELPEGADIDAALRALEIAPEQVQVVMLNGRPQADRSRALSPDDELTVLAPVGGG